MEKGGLVLDWIFQEADCVNLVEIIGDGLDRKVLVGHPGLFGRILVPNLSDGTIFHPILIGSDVSFYTIEEDGVVGGGAAHGVKALVAELSDIETKIVLSAHLIGSVACHVIIGEAFFLFHRAWIFSTLANGSSCRARFTISRLRDSHVKRSSTVEGTLRPGACTVDASGENRS